MDTEPDEPTSPSSPVELPRSNCYFRLFTRESLQRIEHAIEEANRIKQLEAENKKEEESKKKGKKSKKKKDEEKEVDDDDDENKPKPNPRLEAGNKLPKKFGEFPKEYIGKPIEDLDDFYHNQYTFMVVGKDNNLYRFSATNANYCLSPFNPVRRGALFVLTHPIFNLVVMLTILVNCIFMCINAKNEDGSDKFKVAEYVFTAIYTGEMILKITARGFILKPFTYLRDMWNWLDFLVVSLAYITELLPLLMPQQKGMGNVAAIRTFRVLRALKTVAVMPGLKTIVGALMEAVRRLRDVMILTCFVLSIFALIGLQLYSGTLRQKCIRDYPEALQNISEIPEKERRDRKLQILLDDWHFNESNWYKDKDNNPALCGSGRCPDNYTVCEKVGENPNFGYTHFDNFLGAMLCAYRLMTQDYWENLYQLIIRASGPWQMVFFVIVILLVSFYLVNLILAIVAMSYDEVRKANIEIEEEEENERAEEEDRRLQEEAEMEHEIERMRRSPSNYSCGSHYELEVPGKTKPPDDKDRQSVRSDTGTEGSRRLSVINNRGKRTSLSLPASPFPLRRSSKGSFTWRRPVPRGDKQPLVLPCLDNLPLPYADDSNAVSPSSEDLCNTPSHTHMLIARRRLSSASYHSKNLTLDGTLPLPGSRRASMASRRSSRQSFGSRGSFVRRAAGDHPKEPTHFQWLSVRKKKRPRNLAELATDRHKDDHESSSECSEYGAKHKLFDGNPYVCPTPTATQVELQDLMDVKDMIYHVSGKRASFLSDEGLTCKEKVIRKLKSVLEYEPHPCWVKFSHYVELFVMDAFVDLFITLCICINTIFMAMDQPHSTDKKMIRTLEIGNYVFTAIFTAEAVLKIIALNPVNYLKDRWNCFDIVIVIFSLVELPLKNVKGFSILRSFRLLRVFKLAKSWQTLNLLIGIISRTLAALGNLTFVLMIVIFIFAVMGMQLFGDYYKAENFGGEVPRWNFTDFLHSFMIVFRVLCGEWIESMWDCMRATGSPYMCVPFFLLTYIAGSLVVLNLFLALLLSSFGTESLQRQEDDGEPNKLQEAIDRINRFTMFCKSHILLCIKVKCRKQRRRPPSPEPVETKSDLREIFVDGQVPMRNGRVCDQGDGSDSDSGSVSSGLDDEPLAMRRVKGVTKEHVAFTPVSPHDHSDSEDHKKNGDAPTRPVSQTSLSDTKISKSPSLASSFGSKSPLGTGSNLSCSREDVSKPIDIFEGPEINEVQVVFTRYPDDCFPSICMKKLTFCDMLTTSKFGKAWWTFRCYMFQLVEHKYFETFIITMIVTSSLALAVEDIDIHKPNRYWLKQTLKYMDKIFSVIFVIEMLIKWAALGFKKYFTDAWCWLDFVIVSISIVSWAAEGAGMGNIGAFRALRTLRALRPLRAVSRWEGMKISIVTLIGELLSPSEGGGKGGAFRALRTLRALRPLRAVSRWESMKVVVNALIQAIPSILNVLVVCLVFWLIFSIMGVNLFGGRYGKCLDADNELVPVDIVANKSDCLKLANESDYRWVNSDINFDNVFQGYLALLQVATFKGWIEIMQDAVDSGVQATFKGWTEIMNDAIDSQSEVNAQHVKEGRVIMYLYFVIFIVFGSFFTLNLFIGVIIDNFNMQKKKITGGSLEMFMTEDQKRYYNAMKKLGSKAPKPAIPKPRMKCQLFFFTLTTNQKFDIGIMIVIMLNMITMAIEYYNMDKTMVTVLESINLIFISIFTLECVMKIIGLRHYYFKEPWNIFDFVVVILSLVAIALKDIVQSLPISPTLLRVVRVFRVGRVLRLVKSAKGIRTLLFSLAVSLPALFNIGLLLFLVMFIFSIFGMNFFMYTKYNNGIDDMFNFETFPRSLITLFQICTSAGWNGVLAGLMVSPPQCDPTPRLHMPHGDCGSPKMAVMFLVSYLMITFLVIINMYIAVILENFNQATEDVQQGLTQDDFDMYYEIWEKFDQNATQYIDLATLPEFASALEEPLCLPMPNHYMLVKLDIPICKDEKVHCVDILDALTKNFLGTSGDTGEIGDVKKGPERTDYYPISSTLKRQREIVCARIVQRAWRKHVEKSKASRGEGSVKSPPEKTVIILEPPVEESGEEEVENEPGSPSSTKSSSSSSSSSSTSSSSSKSSAKSPKGSGGEPSDSRTVELYPHSDSVA